MKQIITWLKVGMIRAFMLLCRVCKIDRNKVAMVSYYGKGFGDNGKGIALQLLKTNPKLDIVWIAADPESAAVPAPMRCVGYRSWRGYWELATAAVWIDNSRKSLGIIKRKGQFYIQTWHGMVALKRIEKDAAEHLSVDYVRGAKHDSAMADLILSGCGFFTKLCRRAFWYDGEILECGSPRLDVLFQQTPEKQQRVKEMLGIPADKKVLLYAPTFRAGGETDCYIRDYQQLLDVLKQKTGEDWVAAVRLHPNVAGQSGFITYSETVINATDYPDLYELIPAADLVISDYSSLMFDAGLIYKPVFLYATDIADYCADRNFYFDIEKLPFPLAHDEGELLRNLTAFEEEPYREQLEKFNASVEYYENGTASEMVANRIVEVLSQ